MTSNCHHGKRVNERAPSGRKVYHSSPKRKKEASMMDLYYMAETKSAILEFIFGTVSAMEPVPRGGSDSAGHRI